VTPSGVADDSRQVRAGDLFLAYPGDQVDGRRFIGDAIARGAQAVLWQAGGEFAWNPAWQVPQIAVDVCVLWPGLWRMRCTSIRVKPCR